MTDQELRDELLRLFDCAGYMVAVGRKPGGGIVIRSQDERVDASNMGIPTKQMPPATSPVTIPTPQPLPDPRDPFPYPLEPRVID